MDDGEMILLKYFFSPGNTFNDLQEQSGFRYNKTEIDVTNGCQVLINAMLEPL